MDFLPVTAPRRVDWALGVELESGFGFGCEPGLESVGVAEPPGCLPGAVVLAMPPAVASGSHLCWLSQA